MAEGARLESVYTFTGIGGSNPSLSAIIRVGLKRVDFASTSSKGVPEYESNPTAVEALHRNDCQSRHNVRAKSFAVVTRSTSTNRFRAVRDGG